MDIIEGKCYWYNGPNFPHEEVLSHGFDMTRKPIVERHNGQMWCVSVDQLSELQKRGAIATSTTDMILPTDAQERKEIPIITGVLDYFPLAIAEVAKCSLKSNEQHNPGQPLHWNRTKSTDHVDCIGRHLVDRGKFDTDGQRHTAKLAWRALAMLQIELENERKE